MSKTFQTVKRLIFRILSSITYFLRAKTAYQLHGPFISALVAATVEDKRWYYAFDTIEHVRSVLEKSSQRVALDEYGTGANDKERDGESLGKWVQRSAVRPRWGRFLFRIALHFKPRQILEVGTGAGISAAYLAAACPQATIQTIDAHSQRCNFAAQVFEILHHPGISVIHGTSPQAVLQLQDGPRFDMIDIDADHTHEGMIGAFEAILPLAHEGTILIFDDIRWSSGTFEAWSIIKNHDSVRLSADFFQFGLLAFDKKILHKQAHTIVRHCWKPWTVVMGW